MQITRQRVRPEEHIDTAEACPVCKGSGKVIPTVLYADEIDGKVHYIIKDLNKKKLVIRTHPFLAAYLTKGFRSFRFRWFLKYLKWIKVTVNPSLSLLEYQFVDENQEEIIF